MNDTSTERPQTRGERWREGFALVTRGGLLLAALVFAALVVVGQGRPLEVGSVAPPLALRSYDGRGWDLSRFDGRPVIVNFWGTWCPPCLQELPHFARSAEAYGDRLVFVGATVNSPRGEVFEVIERFGVRYPVAAVDNASSQRWNASSLPSTYFLDENHRVVYSTRGALSAKELHALVEEHLGIPAPTGAP
ncbi:MAG: TlpA family protein disulfide reductase [Myxococcota bacterium]